MLSKSDEQKRSGAEFVVISVPKPTFAVSKRRDSNQVYHLRAIIDILSIVMPQSDEVGLSLPKQVERNDERLFFS